MDIAAQSRELWIEQTARLIRIVDRAVDADHAIALAMALWERPGASRSEAESVAEQIAAARHGLRWR